MHLTSGRWTRNRPRAGDPGVRQTADGYSGAWDLIEFAAILGDITEVEIIATGKGIRDLLRLRRLYGSLEEDEGNRQDPSPQRRRSAG